MMIIIITRRPTGFFFGDKSPTERRKLDRDDSIVINWFNARVCRGNWLVPPSIFFFFIWYFLYARHGPVKTIILHYERTRRDRNAPCSCRLIGREVPAGAIFIFIYYTLRRQLLRSDTEKSKVCRAPVGRVVATGMKVTHIRIPSFFVSLLVDWIILSPSLICTIMRFQS